MKISIQWQDEFGHWKHYQMMHHLPGAYRTAKHRAKHTEKRHRLVNEDGTLLDLVEPQTTNQTIKFIRITEMYIQTGTIGNTGKNYECFAI